MSIPRSEYPRPQFVRPDWLCLNGQWQFEIDHGDSGLVRGLRTKAKLDGEITVPFCPESPLSGIGNEDFMVAVWYRREVEIPAEWKDRKVLLHFQACDYDTTVWVNDVEVYRHRGGWTPFTCDLSGVAEAGEKATIVVRARDDSRGNQAGGKQSDRYERYSCLYIRTTGIWQTVWLEPVPEIRLKRARITPDLANRRFTIAQPISNNTPGLKFRATASFDGKQVAQAEVAADVDFAPMLDLVIPEADLKLWAAGEGNLYDIKLELIEADGTVVDAVDSYCGMRSVSIDGKAVKINGKTVFQRQVLDQGYYEDGILTAPSEEALLADITLSLEAGFNSARLHQKVFEERFLYHCDRLGYLVWGEFGDWGIDRDNPPVVMVAEWLEELERDYSHPSIIGWCGLNETAEPITDRITPLMDVTRAMYLAAKAMDPTRPVLDSSGYSHFVRECEIYDSHDYQQDVEKFCKNHDGLADGKPFINGSDEEPISYAYNGQPYFVSEFGGIWWYAKDATDEHNSWGYGNKPESIEEWYERFAGLCDRLLDDPLQFGYCYTQLTDVWQEQNGIYYFDRTTKFDMEKVRAIQTRKAAIEKLDE
jgi:beta-galactosidase/beta-glucuronidase